MQPFSNWLAVELFLLSLWTGFHHNASRFINHIVGLNTEVDQFFFEKPQNSYIKVLFWLFTSNINFLKLKNKTTKKFASHVSAFDVDVKMKYRVCIFNSREVVLNWTNISNILFTLWTLKSRCYRRKRLLHFLIMTT